MDGRCAALGVWRPWLHRHSTRLYDPGSAGPGLSWIGSERLAIGTIPTPASLARLVEEGVTHVVNCRAGPQTWISQDLAAEKRLLGPGGVAHAPMWDFGWSQNPRRWSAAVHFAARALRENEATRVLIHCQRGRRRSAFVAYAVLRLRGRSVEEAASLILKHRAGAELVPIYQTGVEQWLAAGAPVLGRLRTS